MTGRLYRSLGIVWLAALGAAAVGSPKPRVDNSVNALMASDAPEVAAYQRFQSQFGSDEIIAVRADGGTPWARYQTIAATTATLAADAAMAAVLSVPALHPESNTLLLDEVFGGPETLAERQNALRSPVVRALGLWSEQAANLYGLARVSAPAARARLDERLQVLRQRAADRGVRLSFTGPPLLNLALDKAGRRTEAIALPILIGVALALLLALTGSVRATGALFAPVGLTVLAIDGAFAAFGGTTNLLVNIAKPLLFVIGLASGVHVYIEARRQAERTSSFNAPWSAAQTKALPVVLALITTAVGFGSLCFSNLAPVRAFGLVSSVGLLVMIPTILLAVPTAMTTLRALRGRGPPWTTVGDRAMAQAASWLVQASLRRPWLGPGLGFAIVAGSIAALPILPSEPHAIRYFHEDHPLRRDQAILERAGLGIATVEATISAPGIARDANAMTALRAFADAGANDEAVATTIGWPHFAEEVQARSRRPSIDAWVLERLGRQPAAYAFGRNDDVRVAFLVTTVDAPALDRLKAHLRTVAKREFPPDWRLTLTGNYDLLLHAQAELLDTMQTSLALTALIMELVLIAALGSFVLGAVALLPNLFPVAFNLVVMSAVGVPVDLGTTMTAAVALGIAVDDTLHFTLAAKTTSLSVAARSSGTAIMISSVVIGAGFLALLLADFVPTQRFGGLCGLAMASALFADLFVLPPLLARFLNQNH